MKITLSINHKYGVISVNAGFKLACWNFNQHIRKYGMQNTNNRYFATAITTIGKVVALSVLNKVYDPQKHGAESVSDSACRQEFKQMQYDILHFKAVLSLVGENIGGGVDILNSAIVALLEETRQYINSATDINKFDLCRTLITKRELSKKVYIKLNDSKAYRDRETTILQECFRAVRRYIGDNRHISIPQSGYSYIDMMDAETLDTYYYRCNKYADIGGYNVNGAYTVDEQNVKDINTIISALNLTDKQAQILKLRLLGYGYKAISTYLGNTPHAIAKSVKQIQVKWNKLTGINCKGLQD